MRLEIHKLVHLINGETLVEGDTGLGFISGVWKSKHPPVIGEDYDVELTLPDPAVIRLLSDSKEHQPSVTITGVADYQFRGECEVVYEDGVIAVRFATNWIDLGRRKLYMHGWRLGGIYDSTESNRNLCHWQ
ncbi:MAG TPA: hypothetical protein VFO10_23390 [Oligoflexus sp.]|uniref:hypothetical protein n=1 Tax=Oligoflexus sp. TaxID=1971216 RepID=UPI002D805EF2|nr:hypothetical protein [Oligoflexus sp.]HET9240227.1 hypothetical protein [Oligoflexus sp.]